MWIDIDLVRNGSLPGSLFYREPRRHEFPGRAEEHGTAQHEKAEILGPWSRFNARK